ncbi:MAG: hypothetical protein WD847_20495 [Pirellulales bacterium]
MAQSDLSPGDEPVQKNRSEGHEQPASTRIGIKHLMLYTLTCALYAAWLRFVLGEQAALVGLFPGALVVMLAGLLLFGIIVLSARWLRRFGAIIEPGQWLLLGYGVALLLIMFAWTFIEPSSPIFYGVLPAFATGAVFVVGAWRMKRARAWRSALAVFALIESVRPVLEQVTTPDIDPIELAPAADIVLAGLLAAAIIGDYRHQLRRTWLHWSGVVASCGLMALRWLGWV